MTSIGMDTISEPRFTVSAVARRLGVAPATLRTWDRRYGLGPTLHVVGSHRRYSVADVARLEAMRRLVLNGVPLVEAARLVRRGQNVEVSEEEWSEEQSLPGASGQFSEICPDNSPRQKTETSESMATFVPRLSQANRQVRGLARAVIALDAQSVQQLLGAAITERGVVRVWHELLRPVLVALGLRWQATGDGIEMEHMLCEVTHGLLQGSLIRTFQPSIRRPILLACAPGEEHTLPLTVLAAALAERDIPVRLLGRGLPSRALDAAVRRTGPAVLVVWAQLTTTADVAILADLPLTRPPTTILAGGSGWQDQTLPRRVTYVPDLEITIRLISLAVGN